MKGCLKTAITLTGLLLVGVAVITLLGVWQANIWMRGPLETLLSKTTGGICRIDSVQIHPFTHTIELIGVSLEKVGVSPMGASLSAKRVVVSPDAGSLLTGVPTLQQVEMEGGRVEFEWGATPDLTLLVLDAWVKYLGSHTGLSGTDGISDTDKASVPNKASEKRLTVKAFHCDGIQLAVKGASTDVFVPAFDITGVGEHTLSASELTRLFLQKVLEKAVEAEGDTNPLTAIIGKILKRLSGEIPNGVNSTTAP